MREALYTILLFIKEWFFMRIFKTMIPIYGWQVLNGNYVLTQEDVTDGQKVVPERYVPFVADWLAAREDKRKED
jgi:hypothetical protein